MTTESGSNVFEAVAELLPAEQREHFYRRMNRLMQLKQLGSDDDMLQIAEAMGFLALLIRQAPVELASERQKIETALQDTRRVLNEGQSFMLDHTRQLESLLEDLSGAIAEHIDGAAIASPLAETIRQKILSCSLPKIADDLSAHANRLADVTAHFSEQIEQFSVRDEGPIDRVNRALTLMQHQLMNACEHVRVLTNMLTKEVRAALAIFTAGALGVGFFLGILFQQWCGAPTSAQVRTTEALGKAPDSHAPSVTKMRGLSIHDPDTIRKGRIIPRCTRSGHPKGSGIPCGCAGLAVLFADGHHTHQTAHPAGFWLICRWGLATLWSIELLDGVDVNLPPRA